MDDRHEGLLRADLSGGLHAKLDVGRERMGNAVGCEDDLGVLEGGGAEEIADGVVLLLKDKVRGVGGSWWIVRDDFAKSCIWAFGFAHWYPPSR